MSYIPTAASQGLSYYSEVSDINDTANHYGKAICLSVKQKVL
jgi:hypothetical protein